MYVVHVWLQVAACPHSSQCSCPVGDPSCYAGVPLIRDGCGCCMICARLQGDLCDVVHKCAEEHGLECDMSHIVHGKGVCRGICHHTFKTFYMHTSHNLIVVLFQPKRGPTADFTDQHSATVKHSNIRTSAASRAPATTATSSARAPVRTKNNRHLRRTVTTPSW